MREPAGYLVCMMAAWTGRSILVLLVRGR